MIDFGTRTAPYAVFLPFVSKPGPVVGVQVEVGSARGALPYLQGHWIKSRVNWDRVDREGWFHADDDMNALAGYSLLLQVHNCPARFRRTPTDPANGAVASAHYAEYVSFLVSIIDRYNPYAIELWNEPDVQTSPYPDLFGSTFSPAEYADFVRYVDRAIKAVRPNTLILAGALAGVGDFIRALPAYSCDGVSFHCYPSHTTGKASFGWLDRDISLLRDMGWSDIWLTETSYLDASDAAGEALQAEYLVHAANNSLLRGVFWYTLRGNGWRHSDLMEGGRGKPAYQKYCEINS